MIWQGAFPGATQALIFNSVASCAAVNVTVAYPLELVCALAALRLAEPLTTAKFTLTLFCGAPLLRTRAVSGRLTVAPCAIQR
jgi:hypothetical protein